MSSIIQFSKYLEEVIIISYKSQKWIGRKYYSIRKMMRPFDKCLINIFNLFFIGSHGIDVGQDNLRISLSKLSQDFGAALELTRMFLRSADYSKCCSHDYGNHLQGRTILAFIPLTKTKVLKNHSQCNMSSQIVTFDKT